MRPLFSRFLCSPISRRTAVMLIALVALAFSRPALCGEIHDAAKNGDSAKVKLLLKGDPTLVSSKNENGATPLHLAASYGQKTVAELLLANHAPVDAKDKNGETPLHWAAHFGKEGVARLLLDSKADVNASDNYGQTPLDMAATNPTDWGNKEVAMLLRQHGGHYGHQ
jgi:ankyrin repeat protein